MTELRRFRLGRGEAKSSIRVGLSVGLPLLAIYLAGRLDLAAYAALGSLGSLYGHSENARQRIETQLVAGLAFVLTIAVATAYAAWHGEAWLLAALLFAIVIVIGTTGAVMAWLPRGEIFFVLTLLVIASIPVDWRQGFVGIAVSAVTAAFTVALTDLMARAGKPRFHYPSGGLRMRVIQGVELLNARRHAALIFVAAVTTLAAWLLANYLQIGHPYWAPVAVAAIMPALGSAQVPLRVAQLIFGTMSGLAFAAAIYLFTPGPLALISIVVLCQSAAELLAARHYGTALVFLCPLAIGVANISRGLPWLPLIHDRLIETAVGAAVAVVAIVAATRFIPKAEVAGASNTMRDSVGVSDGF